MRKSIFLTILIAFALASSSTTLAKSIDVKSPDSGVSLRVDVSDKIYYSISLDGEVVLADNYLGLKLKNTSLGDNPKIARQKITYVNETFKPVIAYKFSTIENRYNLLRLDMKGGYAVEFRVYDDGVAYRFVTNIGGDIEVMGEDFAINFPSDYTAHLQQPGGFKTAYEEAYTHIESKKWTPSDKMSVLPVLIDTRKGQKILISESDLSDYPCMFLQGTGDNGMKGVFPKAPREFGADGDRSLKILSESDYIALTSGNRSFPWRYFVLTSNDGELLENTMTAKLAPKSSIDDPSWIEPGLVSWEWWNGAKPYGPDVNFVSGFNMDTYKYYIDFASKYNLPYIIMDEGWAMTTTDPYTPNPKVNVHEIIRYGKEKNVRVILWLTWLVVEKNFDLFEKLSSWGVAGVKIDFMDRSDQWMVNYYERVAAKAAQHKMIVSFHGSFKPAGLEYKYPNVLTYEGVLGMEQMGRCKPENTIWLPFIRNAVGPMDYTPGAMISMQPESYRSERPNSASMGTRAYQMAHFVIFETGLQMMADNPTLYYKNHECTKFMTSVPVTWDETRSLAADAGKYVVVAKRKGDVWFIGAITGINDSEGCTVEVSLDFLKGGGAYTMTSFEDGVNAAQQAMDYRKKTTRIEVGDKITIKMARNGGWAAVIQAVTP